MLNGHYSECHHSECHHAESHHVICHYTECYGANKKVPLSICLWSLEFFFRALGRWTSVWQHLLASLVPTFKRRRQDISPNGNGQNGLSPVKLGHSLQGILKGDLLFSWFGLVCFANKNKNCQLSYSWFQTSQTGGQWYSDTCPFSIPCLLY